MAGIGKIDGKGFGVERLVVGRIFSRSILYKEEGKEIGFVDGRFIGQGMVDIGQVVDGKLGMNIDFIDRQSLVDVLIVELIEEQDGRCFGSLGHIQSYTGPKIKELFYVQPAEDIADHLIAAAEVKGIDMAPDIAIEVLF
jgi:hypothetical protein